MNNNEDQKCELGQSLSNRVDALESGMRAVAAGHVQLVAQMSEITVTLHRQDGLIDENAEQLRKLLAASSETNGIVRDIHDAVTAGRVLRGVASWLAGAIITASAAWLAVKGIFVNKDMP